MKKNNKKGFTLAELLIVVAIIAVLVAIAIPVFTTQLEKSREATDLANLRAGYAQLMAAYLEWDGTAANAPEDLTIPVKQTQDGWQTDGGVATHNIGDAGDVGAAVVVTAKTTGDYTMSLNTTTGAVTVK